MQALGLAALGLGAATSKLSSATAWEFWWD